LALLYAGVSFAQLLPPPPPDPKPPVYATPPEEDETLATPKVYTFNPLQAKKEISTGDFYMKRGNYRGAAYRYREATLWDDGNADGFYKLGEASEKLQDYPAAKEAFTKYVALVGNKKKADEIAKRMAKYPASVETPEKSDEDLLKASRDAEARARNAARSRTVSPGIGQPRTNRTVTTQPGTNVPIK
jgi:tetratricopeptide (TPR) repeat protein